MTKMKQSKIFFLTYFYLIIFSYAMNAPYKYKDSKIVKT